MDTVSPEETPPPTNLRIACLEPSATAICARLGLRDFIVGVTHECHQGHYDPTIARVLTKNGLTVTSQGDIHLAVQQQQQQQQAAMVVASCPKTSNDDNTATSIGSQTLNTLYPLLHDQLEAAQPTVIFTQNLCSVCAPTEQDVREILIHNGQTAQVISLQPTTLDEVAETFVTIAHACGIPHKGLAMKQQWLTDLEIIQTTIQAAHRSHNSTTDEEERRLSPSILILEWLDPPFDGGHWTYQMIDYACLRNAMGIKTSPKSNTITWEQVYRADPDVVLVGCCGFELERNIQDVEYHAQRFQTLRAGMEHRIFACNGNTYIAQPGPDLLQGTLILAKCAYQDQPHVLQALDASNIVSVEDEDSWQKVNVMTTPSPDTSTPASATNKTRSKRPDLFQPISQTRVPTTASPTTPPSIMDMEDLMGGPCSGMTDGGDGGGGFSKVHDEACQQGLKTYLDPKTGYQVFTAIAHQERGWCCGSGCRHCPFSHDNVKDKANKIQQPSILYQATGEFLSVTSPLPGTFKQRLKVLFFSGGKDSFLTIRALVRQYSLAAAANDTFALVLITTFDATTRQIAHQEIPIEDVIRQAEHLDLTLLGVPLRRGSGETYLERIQRGLQVIETTFGQAVDSLVFGDLHLGHIKEWRDTTFGNVPIQLEYPLWKVDYEVLMEDLEASQVPCIISGSTVEVVTVGTPFTRELYKKWQAEGLDGFGEQGEFHSLAKVWEVSREKALGIL
jgi:ATP-binding cassette subfamily B (MDR/TAP) protein 1